VKLVLKSGLLDKSTYQLALQEDVAGGKQSMSYQVLDGDEIETYDFRCSRKRRCRPKPARSTRSRSSACATPPSPTARPYCGSPRTGAHLLVRLHQVEKDGKEYRIMLKQGAVDAPPCRASKPAHT